jgi:hypothetical protein
LPGDCHQAEHVIQLAKGQQSGIWRNGGAVNYGMAVPDIVKWRFLILLSGLPL